MALSGDPRPRYRRSSWPDMEVGEPYGRLSSSLGGDLLGELDDQSFRTADIAEPIGVLVITYLADCVEPFVSQTVDDRIEVTDRDSDVSEAQSVRR